MKRLQSSILLLFLLAAYTYSQEFKEILRNIFYEGEFFLMEESYIDALEEYKKLYTRGYSENANINYRMGVCYLNIPGEKQKSIPYFQKAVKNVIKKYREGVWKQTRAPYDAWLYLGNAYRINEELDKAVECYNTYIDLLEDEESEMHAYTEKQIEACNNARKAMENPVYYIRTHTGDIINTSTADINPVVSVDEQVMVYITQLPFYDALKMSRKINGEWSEPINITPELQSDGDQYPNSLSKNGTELYLNREDEFNSDIFHSRYENGRWSISRPLGKVVNTKFWESHACIDPEGEYLYLASNRRGSYGGMDIFVSRKNAEGFWSEPVNLGPGINTELNEDHPFVSPDGKVLYFASQGHYNIGGYDIFYSEHLPDGSYAEPKNLGYPLNTSDDDLFFLPVGNGRYGYQALFEEGNLGSRDIYRFELFETEKEYLAAIAPPEEPEVTTPLDEPAETLPTEEAIAEEHPAEEPAEEITEELAPDQPTKIYIIKPVFFDFDKYSLRPEAWASLDELAIIMEVLPVLNIEATGHTDSKGSESYNMMLSKKRSASVVNYLVSKGIDGKRIQSANKGESSPVAINSNPDGSDNPAGRKLNRRVEFRVLKPELPNVKVEQIPVPDNLKK